VIVSALAVVAAVVAAGAVWLGRRGGSEADTLEEFCDRAGSADLATDRANAFLVTPEADPAEVERLFEDGVAEMRAVAAAAPTDIRAAALALASAFESQSSALRGNDWRVAGVAAEFLVDPEIGQHNSAFARYLGDQCGIEWDEVGGFTDVSTAAEGLATAFAAAALELGLSVEEAECMTGDLTEQIDADRLLGLYGQSLALTRDETFQLVGALESCVETERMVPGFAAVNFAQLADAGVDSEQQSCLSRGVLDTITLTTWAETTVASPELVDELRTIAEGCDVDPRLVTPLVGG
jgi:hypothetical protein